MEKAMAAWPVLTSHRNLAVSASGRLTSQSRKVGWKNIRDPSDLQQKVSPLKGQSQKNVSHYVL